MDNFSITQYGKPLDKSKYTIDIENKVFSTEEVCLVFNLNSLKSGWTFNTGNGCIFNTGTHCTFNTGKFCMFKTANDCIFNVGDMSCICCDFNCTFTTGIGCIFSVYSITSCKFTTYDNISTILDRLDYKRYLLDEVLHNLILISGKPFDWANRNKR